MSLATDYTTELYQMYRNETNDFAEKTVCVSGKALDSGHVV